MTNRLEIKWKLDGFVDEQRYYCSETPIDLDNLPTPKAVLAGDVWTYVDTDIEVGKTYYVAVSSVKNNVEKFSEIIEIETNASPWVSTAEFMSKIATNAELYNAVSANFTQSTMGASLSGSAKWAGGVLAPNGKIYGIPENSSDILIIDPEAGTATRSNMGASLSGSAKWAGGVLAPNGKIYGIPENSSDILIIDPEAGTATRSNMGASLSGSVKWQGGVLAPNGKIYCAPFNASSILVIDTNLGTATTISAPANKYTGGVLGVDSNVYFMPRGASSVLKIDTSLNIATLVAPVASSSDAYTGGTILANAKIYSSSFNAAQFIEIDVVNSIFAEKAGVSGVAKWWGCVLAPNGKIYGIPFNATNISILEPNSTIESLTLKYCLSPHINKF